MSEFKQYKRKGASEMRPYVLNEDMTGISIAEADKTLPTLEGGMIARNPKNHDDKWYVAKKYFDDNLELSDETKVEKTLHNSTAIHASKNVKDIIFWGDGDTFKLISKASSKNEGWMKSTKAMEISGLGCVVQVTTQQGMNVSEAVTFVPGAKIEESFSKDGEENKGVVVSRKLIQIK